MVADSRESLIVLILRVAIAASLNPLAGVDDAPAQFLLLHE